MLLPCLSGVGEWVEKKNVFAILWAIFSNRKV